MDISNMRGILFMSEIQTCKILFFNDKSPNYQKVTNKKGRPFNRRPLNYALLNLFLCCCTIKACRYHFKF